MHWFINKSINFLSCIFLSSPMCVVVNRHHRCCRPVVIPLNTFYLHLITGCQRFGDMTWRGGGDSQKIVRHRCVLIFTKKIFFALFTTYLIQFFFAVCVSVAAIVTAKQPKLSAKRRHLHKLWSLAALMPPPDG